MADAYPEDAPSAIDALAACISGWRQAEGIVQAQSIALDWCVAQFAALKRDGKLPDDAHLAREYNDVVISARNAGIEYLAAMRAARER